MKGYALNCVRLGFTSCCWSSASIATRDVMGFGFPSWLRHTIPSVSQNTKENKKNSLPLRTFQFFLFIYFFFFFVFNNSAIKSKRIKFLQLPSNGNDSDMFFIKFLSIFFFLFLKCNNIKAVVVSHSKCHNHLQTINW